jgi:hypothetical protein
VVVKVKLQVVATQLTQLVNQKAALAKLIKLAMP